MIRQTLSCFERIAQIHNHLVSILSKPDAKLDLQSFSGLKELLDQSTKFSGSPYYVNILPHVAVLLQFSRGQRVRTWNSRSCLEQRLRAASIEDLRHVHSTPFDNYRAIARKQYSEIIRVSRKDLCTSEKIRRWKINN